MPSFSALIGFFVPVAHAAEGGAHGFASGGPGVSDMWNSICSTLPFCDVGKNAPQLVADRANEVLLPLIVGVAVISAIYAGIQLMQAQGSSDGLDKAKTTIKHAVIGVVLMLVVMSIFRLAQYVVTWFS